MHYLEGEEIVAALHGIISEKHQRHRYETDLTVKAVFRLTGPGSVDFGGSEEVYAPVETLPPNKIDAADAYGWWNLAPGSYRIRFNEAVKLSETQLAFLQPHERLLQAGASHSAFYYSESRDTLETTLSVGSGGIRIKENARVSRLLIMELV